MQILLSRTQAGPRRTVKEDQQQISPSHIQRINLISVVPRCKHSTCQEVYCSAHKCLERGNTYTKRDILEVAPSIGVPRGRMKPDSRNWRSPDGVFDSLTHDSLCSLLLLATASHPYRIAYWGPCTEMRFIFCTWLGEICSCSCLPVLPGPAWALLNWICKE